MQFISHQKKYIKYHKIFFKPFKNYLNLKEKKQNYLEYGTKNNIILTTFHLKTLIQTLKLNLKPYKKILKIILNINPDFGKTQKPRDIRMGRGKGEIVSKICFCNKGQIILILKNIENIPKEFIEFLFYECSTKLNITSFFINYKNI